MSTKAIPKSKAKTAYGLLSEIVALVKAEPRRMRMRSYRTFEGALAPADIPPCGTVGCIAGWVTALKRPDESPMRAGYIGGIILGLTEAQASALFYSDLMGDGDQGTRRHANKVIALIRRFQKQYAAQLKAKKV